MEGYKNLIKIVLILYVEGFYYKFRVDMEEFKKYNKGIIVFFVCFVGDVVCVLMNRNYEKVK